jgi:hypothetical protein
MIDIDTLKIGLLEKKSEINKKGKTHYILKSSASFQFNNYINNLEDPITDEEEEEVLSKISETIFNDLLEKTKDEFNSVGIWIESESGKIENSIELSVFEGIKKFGNPGIVPIFEFIKMTIT